LNKATSKHLSLLPGEKDKQMVDIKTKKSIGRLDVVFPVLHGTFGEDGTVQGLLKMMNVPFVGASVLGSAVGMDKDVMKRLARDAGIAQANFVTFNRFEFEKGEVSFNKIKKKLGLPLFIKPANLGSSVGVNKVNDQKGFELAIQYAFQYDNKLIVEEFIKGREVECAVLGNEEPIASLAGEVKPQHEFYSYEAKYIDKNGAILDIPTDLPRSVVKKIQTTAIKVFKVLDCEGMARVDFFVGKNRKVIFNEINTIPGFTKISMYPKLWEISGLPYSELIDNLIRLAIERFDKEKKLKTSYV